MKNGKTDFIQDYCNKRERLNSTLNTAETAGNLPMIRVRRSMDRKLPRGTLLDISRLEKLLPIGLIEFLLKASQGFRHRGLGINNLIKYEGWGNSC